MSNTLLIASLVGVSWPIVALVIFLGLFLAIVAYIFIIPKSAWQRDAQLPLDITREVSSAQEQSNVNHK